MIRLKYWLILSFCWGALAFQIHGQALPEWLAKNTGDRPPPVFGIVDESNFFNKSSGAFKRISDQLRKLEIDYGYKIYLVVEPVLIASTPSEMAAELRRAWVPDGNGLVLVFESDSRHLGIGRDLVGQPEPLENPSQVPSHETTAMLGRAMDSADSKLAPEPYLEAILGNLVREHDGYFARRNTPAPVERSIKTGLLVIGILALLGLGAIAVGTLVRHSSMTAVRSFRFPVVDRPERLGAPCGGSVTARRFAAPVSKP
ncbi:MAG: TPM domain-containing protein [Armatimonadetes bacterium]|nr:TPM domain-containing protein [Akkermansiaceae bacterium]